MLFAALASALIIIYVFLTHPGRRRDMDGLTGRDYAHRGIYDTLGSARENTLPAFERAIARGLGIELDVRLTRDKNLLVIHDPAFPSGARVCDMTLAEAAVEGSIGDGARAPSFAEALRLIDGRAPILVEIKCKRGASETASRALEALREYKGPYAVQSFNPLVLGYFRRRAPEIRRGQLACGIKMAREIGLGRAAAFAQSSLLLNFISRPDFISYNIEEAGYPPLRAQRRLFRARLAYWTIRNARQYARANEADMRVCEWFK